MVVNPSNTGSLETGTIAQVIAIRSLPSNRRLLRNAPSGVPSVLTYGVSDGWLQLTAFGARDRCYFEGILCRAPRPQLKRKPLGRSLSMSVSIECLKRCYTFLIIRTSHPK